MVIGDLLAFRGKYRLEFDSSLARWNACELRSTEPGWQGSGPCRVSVTTSSS